MAIKEIERRIYEVRAKVVDASGAYNNLEGYPKSQDSHHNNDDLDKTWHKAKADYADALKLGETAAANGRPLIVVELYSVHEGKKLISEAIGKMPTIKVEVPDEEPEEETNENPEEPEQNGGE